MTTSFEAPAAAPGMEAAANQPPTLMAPELDPNLFALPLSPETPTSPVGVFGIDEQIAALRQIKLGAKLTPEQETALATIIQDGVEARQESTLYQEKGVEELPRELQLRLERASEAEYKMVSSVEGLMQYLLARQGGRRLPTEDFLQQARVELVRASRRFDPTNAQWSTFASHTISGVYRRVVNRMQPLVPSRDAENSKRAVMTAYMTMSNEGHDPTINEVAKASGVDADIVAHILGNGAYSSLDMEVEEGAETSRTWKDRLADPADYYEQSIGAMLLPDVIAAIEKALPPREASIIKMRFGLDGTEPKTQAEIGDAVGVSQMHVSRLISRSLKVLRNLPVMHDLHESTL